MEESASFSEEEIIKCVAGLFNLATKSAGSNLRRPIPLILPSFNHPAYRDPESYWVIPNKEKNGKLGYHDCCYNILFIFSSKENAQNLIEKHGYKDAVPRMLTAEDITEVLEGSYYLSVDYGVDQNFEEVVPPR